MYTAEALKRRFIFICEKTKPAIKYTRHRKIVANLCRICYDRHGRFKKKTVLSLFAYLELPVCTHIFKTNLL